MTLNYLSDEDVSLYKTLTIEQKDEYLKIHDTVSAFAKAMQRKMLAKLVEGWSGWDDAANTQPIITLLRKNWSNYSSDMAPNPEDEKYLVNVANLAMMLWNFEQQIKAKREEVQKYEEQLGPLTYEQEMAKGQISPGGEVKEDHDSYITVTYGMSGYFAVLIGWTKETPECDGYWEPYETAIGRWATLAEAEEEGKLWAKAEEIEYKSPTRNPRTLHEN